MKVAVIIPVLNGVPHIEYTLRSVFAQTMQPVDVVVVDDGSADRTREVVGHYRDVKLLNNPGSGPGDARNHGLQHTTADAVAFLDHDDLWHPEHLRVLSAALQNHPYAPVASAGRVTFSGSEEPSYTVAQGKPMTTLYDPWVDFPLNKIHEPVCHLIRRQALDRVDGWSTTFDGCADYHLLLKLALTGPVVKTNTVSAAYRIRSDSYFRRLTQERGHEHYALRTAACEDLITLRRAHGLSVKQYVPRWQAMDALATMIQAWTLGNDAQFREAVRRLDASVAPLSDDLVHGIRRQFYAFVAPRLSASGPRTVPRWSHTFLSCDQEIAFAEAALQWLSQWPDDAPRARDAIAWWALRRLPTKVLFFHTAFRPYTWPYVMQHTLRTLWEKVELKRSGASISYSSSPTA